MLGLFLPDFGLDHFVRFLFGRRAQRENHLGKLLPDTPKFIVESARHDRSPR